MSPDECTKMDFREIEQCDVFVAFPGFPASPGTHIEIGWASALQKPTVLLPKKDCEYAFLVKGLSQISCVAFLEYEQDIEPERVEATINSMLG